MIEFDLALIMSELKFIEREKLEKLFGMKSGYVLNFSDRTFREFVLDSVGKDIYDSKYDYQSGSKANRLRAFWVEEPDEVVGRLTADLLNLLSEDKPEVTEGSLFRACEQIVQRLRGREVVEAVAPKLDEARIESPIKPSTERTKNSEIVFVVHGRNDNARNSLFRFLRSVGLRPLEWFQAIQLTGKTTPYIGEILDAAFSEAQAVVVLMTPDDETRLRRQYRKPNDPHYELELTGQSRPNVLFEAGMAFGCNPDRTVLVELGDLRPFSDVGGRHVVKLDNSVGARQGLAHRLELAGCAIDLRGTDWHTEGDFTIRTATADPEIPDEAEHVDTGIDLNAIFVEVQRLAAYDDFYLHHEIPRRVLKNAEERFLPKRETLMAFLDNTEGYSGCDGVAFTASGIYWRNDHNEEANSLSWEELAQVPVKGSEAYNQVILGSDYIDLSRSNVTATHLAKTLRAIRSIVQGSSDQLPP